jgi:hypothetical protein
MANGATLTIAVICEDMPDQRIACGLADRVIRTRLPWTAEVLEYLRRWQGLTSAEPCLKVKDIPRLARERSIRVHGFGQGDGRNLREALLVLKSLPEPPRAVLWIRDTDGHEDRRAGAMLARQPVREWMAWPEAQH